MSKSKSRQPRLGRGLSSLLTQPAPVEVAAPPQSPPPVEEPDKSDDAPAGESISYLAIDAIRPNPHQPRQHFDPAALESLAASIKSDGLMQPVVVRQRSADPPAYELVAGERRWRAARQAELETIPAIVRDLDDRQIAEWALIENLQREDLNPIERAVAFDRLRQVHQLSHDQIADRVGVNRSTVSNSLRLLGLCETVRDMVSQSLLSEGHAKALAGLTDSQAQVLLARRAVQQDWSVRQTEKATRSFSRSDDAAPADPPSRRSAHLADLEQQIARQLGMKVQMRSARKKGAGSITIRYQSLDQFDQLLERLGVTTE